MKNITGEYDAFVCVDTQNDFMSEGGSLLLPNCEHIKEYIRFLTHYASTKSIKVISTIDWHLETDCELSKTPDFKATFPAHCIMDSWGAMPITHTMCYSGGFYDVFNDTKIDIIKLSMVRNIFIYKNKFDVFSNPNTATIFKELDIKSVLVYGVAGDVCVDFAVKGLLEMGIDVSVVTNAIQCLPHTTIEEKIKEWEGLGVKITQVDT